MPGTPSRQATKAPRRAPRKSPAAATGSASQLPSVVNVHEAKTNLSRLLARVEAGEEIIIARAGQPFARLVPLAAPASPGPRVPGRFKGMFGPLPDSLFFEPMSDDELARWEGRSTHPGDPLAIRP